MTPAVKLEGSYERSTKAVECPKCQGFAAEAECTPEEVSSQLCGRFYACCIAAFVCKKCGTRLLAHLEAPDME